MALSRTSTSPASVRVAALTSSGLESSLGKEGSGGQDAVDAESDSWEDCPVRWETFKSFVVAARVVHLGRLFGCGYFGSGDTLSCYDGGSKWTEMEFDGDSFGRRR
jgi:hypothetical protein